MNTFLIVFFKLLIASSTILATPVEYQAITPLASLGDRIISGNLAQEGQFPWQVGVHFTTNAGSFFCGGSLISTNWVLTAGHCAYGGLDFTITLGSIHLDRPQQSLKVRRHIPHESYNGERLEHDIALLELASPAQLSNTVKTISLDNSPLGANVPLIVSGWGKTHDSDRSVTNNLNYVELTSISNAQCRNTYGTLIGDGIVCAVGLGSKSTCSGDSGGPLIRSVNGIPTHVGVVSFVAAAGCAGGYPSGYTRTAYYRYWIQTHTGI